MITVTPLYGGLLAIWFLVRAAGTPVNRIVGAQRLAKVATACTWRHAIDRATSARLRVLLYPGSRFWSQCRDRPHLYITGCFGCPVSIHWSGCFMRD